MFDHASVRPRVLAESGKVLSHEDEDGMMTLDANSDDENSGGSNSDRDELFASTVFGPTCDSIDVIARSVLLPKLKVGDWLYFNNMGAYTMAAASSFNGFVPSDRFYVCSIQPDYFHGIIEGPDGGDAADAAVAADAVEDEKKTE
jgi:Pyridoxal-dependent decarboxylase, C-terminal sheet domain